MLQNLDVLIGFATVMLGFSLLAMIATQLVVTLLNMRGKNLKKGLATLLRTADPGLARHGEGHEESLGERIASEILSHPLVSHSSQRRGPWKLASTIRREELTQAIELLADAQGASFQQALAEHRSKLIRHVDKWFDSSMDRVSQAFVTRTNLVTAGVAALIAITLHLDAFELMEQLTDDQVLRANLSAAAVGMVKRADQFLGEGQSNVPTAYQSAVEALRLEHPKLEQLPAPPDFKGRRDALIWLQQEIRKLPLSKEERSSFEADYRQEVASALNGAVDQLKDEAVNVLQELKTSRFQIVPDPYPGIEGYGRGRGIHALGILASAGLLSLGAPFWFNSLKTLSSMRPLLATKEHKERDRRRGEGSGRA